MVEEAIASYVVNSSFAAWQKQPCMYFIFLTVLYHSVSIAGGMILESSNRVGWSGECPRLVGEGSWKGEDGGGGGN